MMLMPFLHSFLILQVTSSALGTLLLPSIADTNSDYNAVANYRYYNGRIDVVPKPSSILNGYFYTSHNANGETSKVIFLNGPDSEYEMKKKMSAMQDLMSADVSSESLRSENKDATLIASTSTEPSTSSPSNAEFLMTPTVVPNMKEEIKISKENADDKSEVTTDSNKYELQQAPVLPVPYPFLRFSHIHPQLPSTYPGYYEPPSYFRNQYYIPLQNSFFPLHTSYYNPYVSALYQQPRYTSSLSNSIEGIRENFVNSENSDDSLTIAKTNEETEQPESKSQQLSMPENVTSVSEEDSSSEKIIPMTEKMVSTSSTDESVTQQTEQMATEEEMKTEDITIAASATNEATTTAASTAKVA